MFLQTHLFYVQSPFSKVKLWVCTVGQVDTEGKSVVDTFYVTYHGEPLSDNMSLLVTNALQYYLVQSPAIPSPIYSILPAVSSFMLWL